MYSSQRSQAFELATTTERLKVGGGYKNMEKEQACEVTRLHSSSIGCTELSLFLRGNLIKVGGGGIN